MGRAEDFLYGYLNVVAAVNAGVVANGALITNIAAQSEAVAALYVFVAGAVVLVVVADATPSPISPQNAQALRDIYSEAFLVSGSVEFSIEVATLAQQQMYQELSAQITALN